MADKIRVTTIQRLCVNDGPGVRTVVFLKGCYLRCPWCCNPEAISYAADEYFDKGKCKYPEKNVVCKNCKLHGGNVRKTECPLGAYEETYRDYDAEELYDLLMKDRYLYQNGGGITFSGGEPLLQAMVLKALLLKLKNENVHIAFETTLYAPVEHYNIIKQYIDYWFVDLKFQFGYITNNEYNISMDSFESNLSDLQSLKKNIVYRMVVMKEMLGRVDSVIRKLFLHRIDSVEFLTYHGLAKNKYKELNKEFRQFNACSEYEWIDFVDRFKRADIGFSVVQL